ncbi:MAG: type II toxin-antitoxin system VapC family toxin [Acidobacteriota bacterium]
MGPEVAQARLAELKRSFALLQDIPALFTTWETLVVENAVSGKSAHDARLVAAMKVGELEGILTFNKHHFTRYSGITVLTPDEVEKRTEP